MERGVREDRLAIRSYSNTRPLVWAFGDPQGSANRRVELYVSCGGFEVPSRRPSGAYAAPPPGVDWYPPPGRDFDADADGGDDDGTAEIRAALLRQALRGVPVPRTVLERFLATAGDDRGGTGVLDCHVSPWESFESH